MQYRELGHTGLKVSALCLGTMTWGKQNNQADAFAQMDMARDHGINFFDTAEMYAVPTAPETYGTTETIIGQWLKASGQRSNIVLATKACGPGDWINHVRGGPRLNHSHLQQAVEGSLKRLGTDVIDLYQLHWPERSTNFFGRLGYRHRNDNDAVPIEETLEALHQLIAQGKIRHYGISNETAWGAMRYVMAAQALGMPQPASIQNPYSLLNRSYEIGLAEVSHRENMGLLAYSPLAFGMLSGKYRNNQWPADARLTLFKQFSRYTNTQATQAAEKYCALAQDRGLSPTQMALQFVTTRPFVTSTIVGATSTEQLRENLDSIRLEMDRDLEKALDAIHTQHPNPAP